MNSNIRRFESLPEAPFFVSLSAREVSAAYGAERSFFQEGILKAFIEWIAPLNHVTVNGELEHVAIVPGGSSVLDLEVDLDSRLTEVLIHLPVKRCHYLEEFKIFDHRFFRLGVHHKHQRPEITLHDTIIFRDGRLCLESVANRIAASAI